MCFIHYNILCRLGSCCSHAAALMFKVELWVRIGKTERCCTSGINMWIQPSKREVKPARLSEISFRKAKRTDTQVQPVRVKRRKNNVKGRYNLNVDEIMCRSCTYNKQLLIIFFNLFSINWLFSCNIVQIKLLRVY